MRHKVQLSASKPLGVWLSRDKHATWLLSVTIAACTHGSSWAEIHIFLPSFSPNPNWWFHKLIGSDLRSLSSQDFIYVFVCLHSSRETWKHIDIYLKKKVICCRRKGLTEVKCVFCWHNFATVDSSFPMNNTELGACSSEETSVCFHANEDVKVLLVIGIICLVCKVLFILSFRPITIVKYINDGRRRREITNLSDFF